MPIAVGGDLAPPHVVSITVSTILRGYNGIMENKMATTVVYWGL